MRTTITLDDDVAAIIERLRTSQGQTLKEIVNDALREGLQQLAAPPRKRSAFRTEVADLGACRLENLDDIAEVLALAENESFR